MTDRYYRAHVFKSSAADLSSGARDFTLAVNRLASPPTVYGPVVRPLSGRVEASPWTVEVVDVGSTFTSLLASTAGRADLLGRLVQVQRSSDNATWASVGAGRLTDVALNRDVASYTLFCGDELAIARRAVVFTTNTTRLFPPGPHVNYGPWQAPPKGVLWASGRINTNLVHCWFRGGANYAGTTGVPTFFGGNFMPSGAADAIRNDMKPNARFSAYSAAGNFTHTRLRVGSANYPIHSFPAEVTGQLSGDLLGGVDAFVAAPEAGLSMIVVATSSQIAANTAYSSAFLHMFTARPSEQTPLHIGTSGGLSVGTLVRTLYAGTYSSSGAQMPRFSTASADTIDAMGLPRLRFRVTQDGRLQDWIDEHLMQPYGLAAVPNSSGVVMLKSFFLPNSTSSVSSQTLTKTNLASHPTWHQQQREQATVLKLHYTNERPGLSVRFENNQRQVAFDGPADAIAAIPAVREFRHDNVAQAGEFVVDLTADGLHPPTAGNPMLEALPSADTLEANAFEGWCQKVSRESFNRFGDGPIHMAFDALSTAQAVAPGDWLKVQLDTLPNPDTRARGGTRLVQVLSVDQGPAGPSFEVIDAGPLTQIQAPGLTLAASTIDLKHFLRATVSSLGAGGRFQVQLAASSTAPSTGSSAWTSVYTSADNATGAYPIGPLAMNQYYYGRARSIKPGIISSSWVLTVAAVPTSSPTAPNITGTTNVTAGSVQLLWTNGSTVYPPAVHLDTSTSAAFSLANRYAGGMTNSLQPGSDRISVHGLSPNTKYLLGVRYADPYGGFSAADSTTVTSSNGSLTAAADVKRILVVLGGSA